MTEFSNIPSCHSTTMHSKIKTHIFLTGATGYIGGSVLTRLLSHPLSDTFHTTVLVRESEKATQFRKMGIQAVVGTYSDLELLKQLASKADLVIACVDADDLSAANAILEGLKERHEQTGQVPSLIHTSGTGVLIDDARGMYASDTVYNDLNISQLESIPSTQPHRNVDLAIVEADTEGYVKTYIILPPTIYGRATGPLVDAGLQNPRSQQIPQLVDVAVSRSRAGYFGKGANIWSNVHIADLATLYTLLLELIIPHEPTERARSEEPAPSRPRTPVILDHSLFTHGAHGFYFAENGEHTLLSVAEAIGQAMFDAGRATDPEPSPFSADEVQKYFNGVTKFLDSNSRCKADRAKKLGWKPKKTTKELYSSIKQELKSSIS
ncbi:hypothetical protein D9611_001566 [Ephemerocybe angulata]|uniref:NmrA-like domain-containing protein n=1 Tax=Ephemerocybe angulata TaxID=980116 RepID=A0A8H5CHJ4_9AGAR|nr:hypothetical protein D9611_001566 [Tulosesus angulatus]